MITRVSGAKGEFVPVFKQNGITKENSGVKKENTAKPYIDSFVKHSKKSAPWLLCAAAVLTAADCASKKIPVKKSIKNNVLGFFAPVLICSSAILSAVENKKNSENKK
ncbi:MAG: hypothetical protein LUH11_00140 [Candidatus Gastranaerophilales bacterium]|nr:hypothetical protein [Candidatus Gastranaerophilales bacterium]